MRLSWCWVQAKAVRAEIAPRDVKARGTQKTTAPASATAPRDDVGDEGLEPLCDGDGDEVKKNAKYFL